MTALLYSAVQSTFEPTATSTVVRPFEAICALEKFVDDKTRMGTFPRLMAGSVFGENVSTGQALGFRTFSFRVDAPASMILKHMKNKGYRPASPDAGLSLLASLCGGANASLRREFFREPQLIITFDTIILRDEEGVTKAHLVFGQNQEEMLRSQKPFSIRTLPSRKGTRFLSHFYRVLAVKDAK